MDETLAKRIAPAAVVMQIILFGLLSGSLMFAAIVVFLVKGSEAVPEAAAGGAHPITTAALIAGLVALVAQNIATTLIRERSQSQAATLPKDDEAFVPPTANQGGGAANQLSALVSGYQVALIGSAAVLEGATFFNLIAYLLEQVPWSLAMAGLLWVAMAVKFPSAGRVAGWIERTRRDINENRSLRR